MLRECIKIECWDNQDGEDSLELNLDESKELTEDTVVHICVPIVNDTRIISVYLKDLERALRQLKIDSRTLKTE